MLNWRRLSSRQRTYYDWIRLWQNVVRWCSTKEQTVSSGDPVELGIAKSLARPGGNFTGATFLSLDLAAKRVKLCKELLPNMRKLAVLSNTNHPGERSEWRVTQEAAQSLGIGLVYIPFAGPAELDGALARLRAAETDAMLVFPDRVTYVHRSAIAGVAVTSRLPSTFGWRDYVEAGGLISYGPDQYATYYQGPPRRKGRGPANRAADEVRAHFEPKDRHCARPHNFPRRPRPRR